MSPLRRFVHRILVTLSLTVLVPILAGCGESQESQPPAATSPSPAETRRANNSVATIETDLGSITIELLAGDAPRTVENFEQLAQKGFYDGLIFHRVIRGFMIQGGDPKGDGSGGQTASGRPLPNEVDRTSALYQNGYRRGIVAMANIGARPETGTSQFFIMHQDYSLPPDYTIFGRVTGGMEVVDQIATAAAGPPPVGRPVDPVKMKKVTIAGQ